MAIKTKRGTVSLRGLFPVKDAKRLKKHMETNGWNPTKAAVFMDTSKSVIVSALERKSMNTSNITKLQNYLNNAE